MTREEIAKLDEDEVETMLEELMEEMCEADPMPGETPVYHMGSWYFCTDNGIEILPDTREDEDGNQVPYRVVSGLNDREFYAMKPICDKYDIDETFFEGLWDDDGTVTMTVEDIRRQFESEKDWQAVRVLEALAAGIAAGTLPYRSLREFSEQLGRVRLDYGELYFWEEGQYLSLHEVIGEEGETFDTADDISLEEWLYIALHTEEYRVPYDDPGSVLTRDCA